MEMFRILLCFRDGKNLQFCYKSEQSAAIAFAAIPAKTGPFQVVSFTDDYGNAAMVNASDISAAVKTNVNDDLHAQTDLQILQAHNEIWREKKMENDPTISAAMKRMQVRQQLGNGAAPPFRM